MKRGNMKEQNSSTHYELVSITLDSLKRRFNCMHVDKNTFLSNKAGYTATPVACGWAGAVFELLEHLRRSSEAKDRKNIKKVKWGPTNRPTDQPTNRPTNQRTDGQSLL